MNEIEPLEELLDASAQIRDVIQQAEDPEVLGDCEVAGKGSIDGSEIGPLERVAPVARDQ